DACGAIAAGRSDVAAVGEVGHAEDTVGESRVSVQLLAGFRIPDTNDGVRPAGDDALAVWREADAMGRLVNPPEFLARLHVPAAHGAVEIGAGDEALAVRREADSRDGAGVSNQLANLLAGVEAPQANRVIVTARRHEPGLVTEGDRVHIAGV